MAALKIDSHRFEIDLAVFDKDGTLVDFDRLWAGKLARAVAALAGSISLEKPVTDRLLTTLGVDAVSNKVVPESPLAVSTIAKLGIVASVVLYETGMPWHAAESAVATFFTPVIETNPAPEDLLPIGDLPGLMERLRESGVRIAILTSDDRTATLASLPMLGIEKHIEDLVCGDDPFPNKPAPDGLLHLARQLDVSPARIMMVGDSVADMRCGRNAGAGCCLGVLSGTGRREDIAAHAHLVAADIHAIKIAG